MSSVVRPAQVIWQLRLYVAGQTPRSLQAIDNLQKICDAMLNGCYSLQVIDLYQQPELAAGEQIVALPTLIKQSPEPVRIIIGNMSDTERVILGLDLPLKSGHTANSREKPEDP